MSTIIPPPTPRAQRRRWYQLPVTIIRNIAWALFGVLCLSGCGGAALAAERATIQTSADTCDGKAQAIIDSANTCEDAVRGLNALVKRDPACQNVFHAKDPAVTCQGVGVQPRAVQP